MLFRTPLVVICAKYGCTGTLDYAKYGEIFPNRKLVFPGEPEKSIKKIFFGRSVKGWRGLLDLVYFEVFGRIDVNLGFAGFRATSDLHFGGNMRRACFSAYYWVHVLHIWGSLGVIVVFMVICCTPLVVICAKMSYSEHLSSVVVQIFYVLFV